MEGERKPLLLYFTGRNFDTQSFCSITDPTKCYSTRISKWETSWLRTVQHGWYLWEKKISKHVSSFILWNPLNLKKIMLPHLKHNGTKFGNYILSCPPTTNDEICSIYLFWSHSPSIFYYQLGDKRWNKVCFYNEIKRLADMNGKYISQENKTCFNDPVYCNGCLYTVMETLIEVFIVAIEKLQPNGFTLNFTPYLLPATSGFEQHKSHLIGSNNALFRIEILLELDRVTAVYVYKFHSSQRVWEEVESINDRVFYISGLDSAFACKAINPETEGGRIYIALKNCNFFYIYNIEDKSLVTSQHFSNLSERRSYSRWFVPDTRIIGTLKEEVGKSHQIREKKSVCDVVYLKDAGDKAHNESPLPLDVVEVIAKYLNDVLTHFHFRASNKLLRLAAPLIQWRSPSSKSMSRFDDLSMCPLFVFSAKDKVLTFLHPKHGLEYKYTINFPQVHPWNMNYEICCSKDGWLLLVGDNKNYPFFFNPFTKEVISPLIFKNREIRNIRSFGMSHSPTSSECVTVEFDKRSSPYRTSAYVAFLSGRLAYIPFTDGEFPFYNTSPAFHNGLFYFLSKTGKLALINPTRNIILKVLEKLQAPCSSTFNNFLVECDGNLLSVFESPFGKGVQVFKLNDFKTKWMKVESLKNHMLFVGKTSFSAVANIPGMENKIYFPRFYGQSVVFYSLETNNYHTFENDEVVNFHQMRENLNGTWIQPRWH